MCLSSPCRPRSRPRAFPHPGTGHRRRPRPSVAPAAAPSTCPPAAMAPWPLPAQWAAAAFPRASPAQAPASLRRGCGRRQSGCGCRRRAWAHMQAAHLSPAVPHQSPWRRQSAAAASHVQRAAPPLLQPLPLPLPLPRGAAALRCGAARRKESRRQGLWRHSSPCHPLRAVLQVLVGPVPPAVATELVLLWHSHGSPQAMRLLNGAGRCQCRWR
mmetsp:Transcript_53875/g.157141  ORF Transcript_53875/g.157141 Transcript_53875/m.157141 type:complete len:214 (-) Transcript_53875:1022-1663(-)